MRSLSGKKPERLGHRERIPQLFPMAGEASQSVAPPGLWFRKADLSNMREVYKGRETKVEAAVFQEGEDRADTRQMQDIDS